MRLVTTAVFGHLRHLCLGVKLGETNRVTLRRAADCGGVVTWAHQQDAARPLQLPHGRVEVGLSHVRKLVHAAVDQEALEASHSGLDHGPDLQLHTHTSLRKHSTGNKITIQPATWLPGMTPPQKAVSTKHFPLASCSFWWKCASVVVGGMLFLVQAEIRQNNFELLQAASLCNIH